jgi:hypothetical protein
MLCMVLLFAVCPGTPCHVCNHPLCRHSGALLQDHPRWKYLVTTDGTAASNRLDKLLLMNSVALREESPSMMYYYRFVL